MGEVEWRDHNRLGGEIEKQKTSEGSFQMIETDSDIQTQNVGEESAYISDRDGETEQQKVGEVEGRKDNRQGGEIKTQNVGDGSVHMTETHLLSKYSMRRGTFKAWHKEMICKCSTSLSNGSTSRLTKSLTERPSPIKNGANCSSSTCK